MVKTAYCWGRAFNPWLGIPTKIPHATLRPKIKLNEIYICNIFKIKVYNKRLSIFMGMGCDVGRAKGLGKCPIPTRLGTRPGHQN